MRNASARCFWLMLTVAVMVVAILPDGTAFANAKTGASLASGAKGHKVYCLHQVVHLKGSNPPSITCFDNKAVNMVNHKPDIGTVGCNGANVTLWWDASFNGPTICFSGDGFANLTNYAPPWYEYAPCHCLSWNHQASGFALFGCTLIGTNSQSDPNYPGYFATDTNGNGQRQYFKWNVSKSWSDFTGLDGILPNDSLSSIYIDC